MELRPENYESIFKNKLPNEPLTGEKIRWYGPIILICIIYSYYLYGGEHEIIFNCGILIFSIIAFILVFISITAFFKRNIQDDHYYSALMAILLNISVLILFVYAYFSPSFKYECEINKIYKAAKQKIGEYDGNISAICVDVKRDGKVITFIYRINIKVDPVHKDLLINKIVESLIKMALVFPQRKTLERLGIVFRLVFYFNDNKDRFDAYIDWYFLNKHKTTKSL